ncbi:hypothetical protein B0I35DRAFT_480271 [Stachybotrys elegans]|uniref:MARVEL domain-containing protein n=1 Tax=Stachybotrys elegans TaxID=80388 RepID=A0A8K0WQY7_9HYPO|nr:hypothetical protein B0I35DRAFT_480271 [Stachybotrys elegans]
MSESETKGSTDHILQTPRWVFFVHIAQVVLSLVILAMAGWIISDVYFDEPGLALAISLITWIVVGYIVLTEKLAVLRSGYNIIAVLVLEGLMVILWLATFAAAAAARARFVYPTSVSNCFDDGSLINSMTCSRKRDLAKRAVILFDAGLRTLSAVAGLGALVWLLFVATFSATMVHFFRARKEGRFLFNTKPDTFQMEAKTEAQPQQAAQPAQTAVPVQDAAPIQPQYTGQYPPQQYPPQQYPPQQGYDPSVSPYQHQSPYPPPQQPYGQYPPQQYQQPIQPQGTGPQYQVSPMQSQAPLGEKNELMNPEHGVPHTTGELDGSQAGYVSMPTHPEPRS